ncbi:MULTISPECIES: electron transfer flavoprotein subunit alpha/FixB family protein [Rhodomicrobium]|uniref:electron transfer flavoprotein subunit alpha/FixB family protein n=1 Tax=Rhodomicrobium TaxID=1068 RepID=UPI000B4B215D|nr:MULTISPECIES: electron transfer flavoprotein subunit alpha/FixB family protein [Rhodomicrobium]
MSILLFADHIQSALAPATAKALTAAKAIGGEIDILVAGKNCGAAAEGAAKLAGVRKVLIAEADHLGEDLAEEFAALVTPLMANYDVLLAPATTTTKNFMPRVAAQLDVPQISEIIAVDGPRRFARPIYAGNAIQTVEAPEGLKLVITVRAPAFAAAPDGGSAVIETIAAPAPLGLSKFESAELSSSDRPELTAARIIISGGRGMQSGDNFKLIEKIADKLGAAIGASRAAVDAGYVPNDYQVGQTGKIVAPELYIAVGISGAIQHLAGMKDAKIIVAINKDEEAPIFQVADYGLVADLFQALPELEAELTKAGL